MNKCSNCGTEFEGSFCPECGRTVGGERLCPNCKNKISGTAKFCNECGYSFTPKVQPSPKKKGGAGRWFKEHKKAVGWIVAILVLAIILSIVIPMTVINRNNGTYYLYENGNYNYERYYTFNGNTYTDQTGYSCDVKFDGEKVELYTELFGVKDVFARGTLKDGVLQLEIMGAKVTFVTKDHQHNLIEEVIKEPTCDEEGSSISFCACGYHVEEPESIPALGHDFDETHRCKRCGLAGGELLEFSLINDGSAYEVNGIGECRDNVIIIPSTHKGLPVTAIGYRAFYGCSRLTSISIPDSVTSIGRDAFWDCSGLTSVTIGNGVTSIERGAFYKCSGLTEVIMGKGVISIEDEAFYGCTGLISISIPNSVTSIGISAFRGCSGLTSVTIGSGVTSIGISAFRDCSGLQSVVWNAENCTKAGDYSSFIFNGCTNLSSVTFGENVKTIPAYAFYGCSGLTSISIPDSVTSIGYGAFEDCSGLTEIKVGESNQTYHAQGNCLIETESKTLVLGCKTSEIPNDGSVTSIGGSAFYDCSGLTSISIPDSVTSIGEFAFYGCSGLTSISIPNSVTSIGYGAFRDCSGLTGELKIPDSVTSIERDAFRDCSGLTSVTIGSGVTSIGEWAFYGCSGLKEVRFENPNGWKAGGKALSGLEDPATAADYLENIYRDYDWVRKG